MTGVLVCHNHCLDFTSQRRILPTLRAHEGRALVLIAGQRGMEDLGNLPPVLRLHRDGSL